MATIPISDGDPKNTYTATAGQTTFAYTFWIKEEDHLAVYVNGTLKALTTDYTISAVQSTSGANVVFTSGLTLNDSVVLVYDPAFTRTAEYTGTIRLEALNTELTYLLTLLQSNQRKIDDAIRTSDSETVSFDGTVPALTGNGGKVLALNSTATGLQYLTVSDADSIVANFESQTFDGDGADTTFTLTFTPLTAAQILVWVGGVRQFPGTDYTTSGTTLTFSTAPPTGTGNITVLNLAAAASVNTPADLSVTTAKLAADSVTSDKIAENAVNGTMMAMGSDAQGDILYYDGTNYSRLGAGTSGQYLQTQGAGANPQWGTITSGGLVLLGTYTASNATSVDIHSGGDLDAAIDSTYDEYIIKGIAVVPATDNRDLYIRTSTDTGSTFDSGASDYVYGADGYDSAGVVIQLSSTGAAQIEAVNDVGNASGESCNFTIYLKAPSNSSLKTQMEFFSSADDGESATRSLFGCGLRASAADVDGIRILFNTGNITSGEFKLYGVRKS